jgi:Domain of Unknown Function with PDB structure (DUF3857)/Transglutaminase-like superfamily
MRLSYTLSVFAITLCTNAFSYTDTKYPVASIPEELKRNADVVFRKDEARFTILSKSSANYYVHQVVTILNANGKDYAREVIGYDKLSKVNLFKGTVYDANGNVIKKLKSNEIYDQSAFDGFSLYSDNRLKAADLTQGSYPYTVDFEYEIDFKYLFFIPGFNVVSNEKVSVEFGQYELVYPTELRPRFKTFNIDQEPTVTNRENGKESTTWVFKNIQPITIEPMGPPVAEVLPHIIAAPTTFEYDDYAGSMQTWDEFGQWIQKLNKDRNKLSPETLKKIVDLTGHLKTPEEKAKVLYEYMQSKTRYVSIQLGIGGFQPFEAITVDNTGYGDCKALSNYMVSMLEVAGVKANYVLIKAGKQQQKMNLDFPSSQFNHAVVCVPIQGDTLWLECTSQTNPFGYAGTFTGNRQALAITDKGASVVNTPVYLEADNMQRRTADVTVDSKGNATANISTTYTGLQYENDNLHFLLNDQFDEQKKWVQNTTDIPSFEINSFKISDKKEIIPSATVQLNLNLNRFASVSGKRLFITPNLMNRFSSIPEPIENRKTNVVRNMAYTDLDTIQYSFPQDLYPEFVPAPTKIESEFGSYENSYSLDQGKLIYTRRLVMKKGEFAPESYKSLIDFYKKINKADHTKLVLLGKT